MKKMKTKAGFALALLLLSMLGLSAGKVQAQVLGVKTNALAWATGGSINLGLDVGFARKWTVGIDGIYNPFTWGEGRKTKVWGFQPEVRFWPRYRFTGPFVGLHGHYAQYDWGLSNYVYKGDLYGAGVSCGYAWMLSPRWNIEATAGFGYTRLDHDTKRVRKDYSYHVPAGVENKWHISRLGILITYFFK